MAELFNEEIYQVQGKTFEAPLSHQISIGGIQVGNDPYDEIMRLLDALSFLG